MLFTEDFVSDHVDDWKALIGHLAGRPGLQFLEIGAHEGRSAAHWLQHYLTAAGSQLVVIDPWDNREAERAFDVNMERIMTRRNLTAVRGFSERVLGSLNRMFFDFAYIDGSHEARDVLVDGLLTIPLMKPGGIMLFDDYEWDDPRWYVHAPAKVGIDAFLSICAPYIDVISRGVQIAVQTKCDRETLTSSIILP